MDGEQQNTPRLVWYASWLLILELRGNSKTMLVKPGGHFKHVEPEGVTNQRELATFFREEFMLPTKICYDRCKG